MRKIRNNTAGIDIGAKHVFVGLEGEKVKRFETFTEDLERLAVYLLSNKITSVAMEATGVYWVILYDILDIHEILTRANSVHLDLKQGLELNLSTDLIEEPLCVIESRKAIFCSDDVIIHQRSTI